MTDKLRDHPYPKVLNYALHRSTLTPIRRFVNLQTAEDYGADPVGDGQYRMIPSGEIVGVDERNRRLARFHP